LYRCDLIQNGFELKHAMLLPFAYACRQQSQNFSRITLKDFRSRLFVWIKLKISMH